MTIVAIVVIVALIALLAFIVTRRRKAEQRHVETHRREAGNSPRPRSAWGRADAGCVSSSRGPPGTRAIRCGPYPVCSRRIRGRSHRARRTSS